MVTSSNVNFLFTLLHLFLQDIAESQPTTRMPLNTTGGFECCGVNTINDLTRVYVDGQIQGLGYNYSLPLDPCEFSSINMTWILSIADLTLLDLITPEQVLEDTPCEIWTQMPPDFLSTRGLSAITTDAYWFGSDPQCVYNASRVLDCSDPNRTINNYTSPQLQCFWPFVTSKHETPYNELNEAGYKNCRISCEYYPINGDIDKLDAFNLAASIIAILFTIGFFINVMIEIYKAYHGKTQFLRLPLTFDIPIVIAFWLFLFAILLLVPHLGGKQNLVCDPGSTASIPDPVRENNPNCFVYGNFFMIATASIYWYCSLLSFAVWNSLYFPFKPLFGFSKLWYHLIVNLIVAGYWIGTLIEDEYGALNVTGICGYNIKGDYGVRYLFTPLVLNLVLFTIFTILSVVKLIQHYGLQQKRSEAEKAIFSLAVRMVIYSAFIAASLSCMLYVSSNFLNTDEWEEEINDNVNCWIENELGIRDDGNCPMEIDSVSDSVYYMQGTVLLLVSVASFVLTCSNSRFNDYGNMRKGAKLRTQNTMSKIKSSMHLNGSKEAENSSKRAAEMAVGDESMMTKNESTNRVQTFSEIQLQPAGDAEPDSQTKI